MSKSSSRMRSRMRSYWRPVLLTVALVYCVGTAISAVLSSPTITTIAGGGSPASGNGDYGPATSARLTNPVDVAVDASGNVYIADIAVFVGQDGFKVRKVDTAGIITTVAGNGDNVYNGDGIAATSAAISVKGIAVDAGGNLYIADAHNQRIRKVAPNGMISTVAGNGTSGFTGDGGQAKNATLSFPADVAIDAAGNLYVLDAFNVRVRRVGADGIIRTVAGNGQSGFSGDGGAATQASFSDPRGIAIDAAGNLFIADHGNDRVRRVTPAGIISTFAGGGRFRSDPVAANSVLFNPTGVAVDARGNVYISEFNNLVRIVSPNGIVQIAAGQFNDTTFGSEGAPWGFAGDGGPADQALLYEPMNLALDAQQNLYVADGRNGRVRKVAQYATPRTPAGVDAFRPYQANPVGSFTQHVAVADVTGDGRDDALLTTSAWPGFGVEPDNDMRLWVFVQRPDGTLAPPLKYAYPSDGIRAGTGLATADLDRDGFKDVFVGTLYGVAIFRGNPGGVSNAVLSAGVGNAQGVNSIAAMDVDRDGHIDIVTLGCCRPEGGSSTFDTFGMTVHYGNGAGGIARKVLYPSGPEVGGNLKAVDMNRDGIPDLIKTWSASPNGGVDVMLHNGVAGFRAPIRVTAVSQSGLSGAYAVGDFDHDGLRDIILSRRGNAPHASYVHFRQNAQGHFDQVRDWRAFDLPDELLAADMDGDARDDLLVVHGGWSSIGYHQQTDTGLDTEVKNLTVQSGNPRLPALAVGDLDADGCKDIAMADYNYGLIVMHGKRCVTSAEGSRPLLPWKPAGPATGPSGTLGAYSAGPPYVARVRPPATTSMYRRIVNALPDAFAGNVFRADLLYGAAGLFAFFFGLLWFMHIYRRK